MIANNQETMSENVTKPTIETILERITALEERLGARLDHLESISNITRGEMLGLRGEFRELRVQLKEHFPILR
jgi:hypothetical protein